MSISLSTLTNPATSDSVLLEAQSEADFLEPIVLFKNRATGSNAISNDATQTTANDQPLSLPLIKNPSGNLGGYLYIPNVSGNYATGPSVTIGANETWEGEVDMMVTDFGPSSNYLLPMGGGEWLSGFGLIIYHDGDVRPWSKGAVGGTEQPSGVALNTPFNAKYGFDGTNLYVDIDDVRVFTGTASTEQSNSITHPLELNQQTLTQQGDYAIQKAKLTVNSAVVFDCDFNGSTSIEDGATSFEATTGGTVTINTGSGVDQARIVRRPKALFNDSEMDLVWSGPTGDYFFVTATENGVVSGEVSLVNSTSAFRFASLGLPRTGNKQSGHQTLVSINPNTISDSQKQALVDYAKSKSAGKNWAGTTLLNAFFRTSNLKHLDASYWDTSSNQSLNNFVSYNNSLVSLDLRGWDTSSVTNCNGFAYDSELLTEILLDGNTFSDSACTSYGNSFIDTNLNQATIDDILVRINAAGTSNGTFDRSGGEYPSTTGVAAKNALQARGWSMTFSSEVLPSVLDLEPAAAYSLRALKSSEDPNVVNVRRSSDGALSNFKASEVSDGTLTTWVGEQNLITYSNSFVGNWSLTGSSTLTAGQAGYDGTNDATEFYDSRSNTSYGLFKVISSPINGQINASIYLKAGTVSTGQLDFFYAGGVVRAVSFDLSNGTVEAGVLGGAAQVADAVGITNVGNGWYRVNLTQDYGSTLLNYLRVGLSSAGTIFVQDAQVVEGASVRTYAETNASQSGDGHVTTWYDQAGSNDASQPLVSNMPKIVDGGTLVTEGGKPAVDFDGAFDFFDMNHSDLYGQSTLDSYYVTSTSDTSYLYPRDIGGRYGFAAHANQTNSTIHSSYGTPSLYSNGILQSISNRGDVYTSNNGYKLVNHQGADTSTWGTFSFGRYDTVDTIWDYNGKLQEMIFFNTDQSANRIAIETNINDHFDIYS